MLIAFDGISRPIALIGCADLRECLAAALPGWRCAPAATSDAPPIIRVVHRADHGYLLESPWLEAPFYDDTEVGTVCALILDLIAAYVAERPWLFCLHCAAAEFAGRLVIFPSTYRAGKSTLVARLAAAGIPVYTDDVLPVTRAGDEGVALGIAPRLRLPLPRGAGRSFRRFVATHRGPHNHRYLYLNLPLTLAAHGRRAPIGGIVLLDRQPDGRAALVPASQGEILQRLIAQHFARAFAATEIVDRLHDLVSRLPCLSLRYARLDDALAVLQEAFAAWPAASEPPRGPAHADRLSPRPTTAAAAARAGPGATAGRRFRQHPAVAFHGVEDDLFLVDRRDQSIYHLNLVGAGLWRLLRAPSTAAQAIAVLQAAFPDADPQRVEHDVAALLDDLLANGLIVPQDAAGARPLTAAREA